MSKNIIIEMQIPDYLSIEDIKESFNHLASKRYGSYSDSEFEDCKIIDIEEGNITNVYIKREHAHGSFNNSDMNRYVINYYKEPECITLLFTDHYTTNMNNHVVTIQGVKYNAIKV